MCIRDSYWEGAPDFPKNYRIKKLIFIKPHHRCQFSGFSRYFGTTFLQMPPLRGLAPLVLTLLHRCRPYGTKEGFWHVQSLWLKPGTVGNSEETPKQINPTGLKRVFAHTRFASKFRCGWETAPTGLGLRRLLFLKLTVMVRFATAATVFWYGKTLPMPMYRGLACLFKEVCPFVRAIVEG